MFDAVPPPEVKNILWRVCLTPQAVRGVVRGDPSPVVADYGKPNASGECSGDDDSGYKRVANDASGAVVGCLRRGPVIRPNGMLPPDPSAR